MTSTSSATINPAPKLVRGVIVTIIWVALWQLAAMLLGNGILLATPVDVVLSFGALAPTISFWSTIGYSVLRIAVGFLLAVMLGTGFAWLASLNSWIRAMLSGPIKAIRSVPVVSFIILVLIWSDASWLSVTISCLMVLPIVYTNVEEGIDRRNAQLDEFATVFALSASKRWWAITLPGMLPYLQAACRVGLGLAWKAGVSAEVIGLPDGSIGERLYQAKLYLATGDLFCWTGVIIALSIAFEKIVMGLLFSFEKSLGKRWLKPTGKGQESPETAAVHPIKLANVRFCYPSSSESPDCWEGLTIEANSLIVTGPNGSGKTTILKLILGLLKPLAGTVQTPPGGKAAVFQEDRLIEHLSPISNIRLANPCEISNEQLETELQAIGLAKESWLRPVNELSGGQRRRVCIVRAMITNATLIGLDEPFTGIDAETLPAVRTYVRDRLADRNYVLITHNESDLAEFSGIRFVLN